MGNLKKAITVIIIIASLAVVPFSSASAASSGPNLSGTGVDGGGTDTAWANPGNIKADDTAYASATLASSTAKSNYLWATNFGFTIPTDASISGITVTYGKYSSGTGNRIEDDSILIIQDGVILGTDHKVTGNWPTGSVTSSVYGSTSDLWGVSTTWTPALINQSNFGVAMRVKNRSTSSRTGYVDYVTISVEYTLPLTSTTTEVDCGSGVPSVIYGDEISCTATVRASSGATSPSGTVTWTTGVSGTFTPADTCSLTGTGGSATCTVSYTPDTVGIGTHLITATYGDNTPFTGSSGNQSITVDPKTLTITAADQSKTYGNAFSFAGSEFTPDGLINSDTLTSVTLTSDGAPATATVSGSPYAIVASAAVGTGLDNYDIAYVDGSFTVDPKDLTITAADQSKTYGDAFTFLGTEFTSDGLVNSDTVTSVTLTSDGAPATATVSASPYAIVASAAVGTGLDNYDITYNDGSFTVDPKTLTITAADQSKTYGDAFTFLGTEFTSAGLLFSDSISSVTLTSDGAPATATVSGSPYTIVASAAIGTGLDNYDIDYIDGSFTVSLKTLTITAADQSKTYGDAFTFLGTEFTSDDLLFSDSISSVTLTSDGAPAIATVSASPYAIVASAAVGTGLENYDITYTDGSFTVDLKTLTITAADQSKTYGETFSFAGSEFTPDGLVNADTVTSVTLTSDGAPTTATVSGSPYAIVASAAVGTNLENYDITYTDGTFTVDPKDLTITAANQSKTYGDAFTFLGTEFTSEGLLFSDSISSVTLTSDGAPATATVAGSPYAIVASAAVGTGLDNYEIYYVDGNLAVDLRVLTIFPDDLHKTYGDTFTFLGTEFTAPELATLNGDTITFVELSSDGAIASANVGSHDILADNAVGTGLNNYTIIYGIGHLFVDPKDLTITADDQSKTYGDAFTFMGTEFTPDGLVNSDTVSSVTLTSDGTPATATVSGSPYAIVASAAVGTGLDNYDIVYVDGSFTVDPKDLTITAADQSKTYGDAFSFTGTEFTSRISSSVTPSPA